MKCDNEGKEKERAPVQTLFMIFIPVWETNFKLN